jgi:hypothetical protein
MARIAFRFQQSQQRILDEVLSLSAAQLQWRPAPELHPIGFVVWHVARYADLLQATVPKMTAALTHKLQDHEQIWVTKQLAHRWGWQTMGLGNAATGKGIGDEQAAQLPLPPQEELFAYLQESFAAAAHTVNAVDDRDFLMPVDPVLGLGDITVGHSLLANLVHNNQHLGEISCLRSILRSHGW